MVTPLQHKDGKVNITTTTIIEVGGKDYTFKRATLKLMAALDTVNKELALAHWTEILTDKEAMEYASMVWDKWLDLTVVGDRKGLEIESLSFLEIKGIQDAFFASAFGTPKPNA